MSDASERESQKVEMLWETPSQDEITAISKDHVAAMESSDGDDVWQIAGMHHVVIRTIGRRSGKEHKVALPTWRDPDGHRIVVASFAGATAHPAWFLNLRDRDVNPEVLCRVQGASYWSVPEILEGAERAGALALHGERDVEQQRVGVVTGEHLQTHGEAVDRARRDRHRGVAAD